MKKFYIIYIIKKIINLNFKYKKKFIFNLFFKFDMISYILLLDYKDKSSPGLLSITILS